MNHHDDLLDPNNYPLENPGENEACITSLGAQSMAATQNVSGSTSEDLKEYPEAPFSLGVAASESVS